MSPSNKRFLLPPLAAVLWLAAVFPARAQETVAVLSAGSGPYQAAFDSFQKRFGGMVSSFRLPQDKPRMGSSTRVVVAFGGEAALQAYPRGTTVIACLAPGLTAASSRADRFTLMTMKPSADLLLAGMRKVYPGLKRLAVLGHSEETTEYLKELKASARPLGIEIVPVRASEPEDVPDALRSVIGKADALWLAPDPGLVTPQVFETVKQFSWDNAMPFFAPTAGLAAAGAAAAVSADIHDVGIQAAELAKQVLAGAAPPRLVYPAKVQVTVNPESAAKSGLTFSPEALSSADKVIQ